jgi:hypothetical protein
MKQLYPLLFEGVADTYAEKEFHIPDETKYASKKDLGYFG